MRALAQLGHQNIVIVYEFGQRDRVFFLLMDFVDGVTLRQLMRAGVASRQLRDHSVSGTAPAAGGMEERQPIEQRAVEPTAGAVPPT